MSFRKEVKYRLTYSESDFMKNDLLSRGMQELHPPRIVNSCYFDTRNFELHNLSEEGVLPRKKLRLRWYDDSNEFTKETKISSLEGRFKLSEKFVEISNSNEILECKFFDQIYGQLLPSINISYERQYFSFGDMRLTFDKNITYKYARLAFSNVIRDSEAVIECKIPYNSYDEYACKVMPMPSERFSKYSRGLLLFEKTS